MSSSLRELASQLVNDALRDNEWDGGDELLLLITLVDNKIDCAERILFSISLFLYEFNFENKNYIFCDSLKIFIRILFHFEMIICHEFEFTLIEKNYLLALSILMRMSNSSFGIGTIAFVWSLLVDVDDSVDVDVEDEDGELGKLLIIAVVAIVSISLDISVLSFFSGPFCVSVVVGISFF